MFNKIVKKAKKEATPKKDAAQVAFEKMRDENSQEVIRMFQQCQVEIVQKGWHIQPVVMKGQRDDVAIAQIMIKPIPYEAHLKASQMKVEAEAKAAGETKLPELATEGETPKEATGETEKPAEPTV